MLTTVGILQNVAASTDAVKLNPEGRMFLLSGAAFSLFLYLENVMRKDVGEAIIKASTNVTSLGVAGAILLDDRVTVAHGIFAGIIGLIGVAIGVIVRDWRKK